MIRKVGLLIAVLSLMIMSLSPVQAQSEPTISFADSVVTSFPDYIDFNLHIESDVFITDVRLHYTVERESFADVTHEVNVGIPLPFQTAMDVLWRWDMRTTGTLPSGTAIKYWWTLKDTYGKNYKTIPKNVSFKDTNYSWKSIAEGNITIYWYSGDEGFVAELMRTCQEALVRLSDDTGAYLEDPIRIYIYSSSSALRNAMIFAQQWAGGAAYPGYGVIAIGISKSNIEWGKRAPVHEIAHMVTHQITSNPYNFIPVWLNEGISMYAEGVIEESFESYLKKAAIAGTLIS
ncbi:MAG: peptidase MA family metallohydrolase, partial [Dehalococcoidales bacterium]|nr:peptidase MA family metallohydrolase [Dehalococcoidales bacterium]